MILLAMALLLAFAGCGGRGDDAGSPAPSPGLPSLAGKDFNIVLVSFDALRAMDASACGYALDTTPNLKELAKSSYLFQNAIAPASWTLPSTMSIFTARYPSVHGVVNKLAPGPGGKVGLARLKESIRTLPQDLKDQGYLLGAFTGDAGVSGAFGYGRGFETFLDDVKFGGFDHSQPAAIEWLKKNRDRKLFLFLHGYDCHGQYDPPGGYTRMYCKDYRGALKGGKEEQGRFRELGLANKYEESSKGEPFLDPKAFTAEDARFYRALYDEKIRLADSRFGELLNAMKEMGLMERTIFIVLADHGEEFMEHGYIDHGPTLYQEMIHVPLVIRIPGYPGGVVTRRVSAMDALPTALDCLGIKTGGAIDGKSLMGDIRGKDMPSSPVFSETDYRLFGHKRCMVKGDYSLIYSLDSGKVELYNLRDDPGERHNLAQEKKELTAGLLEELEAWIATLPVNYPRYDGGREGVIKIY